jgi:uncharacterized protein involved in outer membrane biogenesis
MKKALWIIGGLFIVLLVAVVSVPLFVDVDRYRPQITEEVNKRINGQLELGKLKLSLWGAIKIHAESIVLKVNGFPEPLVNTDQFRLEIPYLSVLSGKPEVVAVLQGPKIQVVKNKAGKMNVLELMPQTAAPAGAEKEAENGSATDTVASVSASADESATAAASPADSATPAAPAPVPATATASGTAEPAPTVPALVAGATLGLRILDGNLLYQDEVTKARYQVNGMELEGTNLGLGSEMKLRLRAPVKGTAPAFGFEGVISAASELKPVLSGNQVRALSGAVDLDATQLKLEMKNGSFRKPEGMPLTVRARFDGNEAETLVRSLELRAHDIKVNGKGRITLQPVTAKMELVSDPVQLAGLKEMVPMLAAYQLKGVLHLNANVDKQANALRASGDVKVSDGAFHLKDTLKAPLQFQLQAGFSENTLNIIRANLTGPDSDLQLSGNVKEFLAPQFSLSLTGKSLNVDKVLVFPEAGATEKTAAWPSLLPAAHAAKPKEADANPLVALAANPMVAKASGNLSAQLGRLTVKNAVFEQVQAKARLDNLLLKITEASLKTFGGVVKASGDFHLRNPALNYKTVGSVSHISAKEAFATYFPKFKNTIEGQVNANWNVSGALYPATARLRSLSGTARLTAADGVFKSVDFQDSINAAMKKVPFLKNKKPISVDEGFKSMVTDLKFANGTVRAEPIDVQPQGNGFVIKGKSTIQESLEQESFFDVYDPSGQLPKEIRAEGKPALALRLYGPINAPKTDYEYTVKKLAANAGKNAVKDVATKALDKVLGGEGGSKNDKLKDAADKLRKKFKLF